MTLIAGGLPATCNPTVVIVSGAVLVPGSGTTIVTSGGTVQINTSGDGYFAISGATGQTSGQVVQIVSGMDILNGVQMSGCFLPCSYETQVSGALQGLQDSKQASGNYIQGSGSITGLSGQVAVFGSLQGYSGFTYQDAQPQIRVGGPHESVVLGQTHGGGLEKGEVLVTNLSSLGIDQIYLNEDGLGMWDIPTGGLQEFNTSGVTAYNGRFMSGLSAPTLTSSFATKQMSGIYTTSGDVVSIVSGMNITVSGGGGGLTSGQVVQIVSGMYVGSGLYALSGSGGGASGCLTSSEVFGIVSGCGLYQTSGGDYVHGGGVYQRVAVWTAVGNLGGNINYRVVSNQFMAAGGTEAAPTICYSGRADAGIYSSGGLTSITHSGVTVLTAGMSGITTFRPITDCSGHKNNWYERSGISIGQYMMSGTVWVSGIAWSMNPYGQAGTSGQIASTAGTAFTNIHSCSAVTYDTNSFIINESGTYLALGHYEAESPSLYIGYATSGYGTTSGWLLKHSLVYAAQAGAAMYHGNFTVTTHAIRECVPGDRLFIQAAGSVYPGGTGTENPAMAIHKIDIMGPQGASGAIGPQGPVGVTGAVGPQGVTGAIGPTGLQGVTGAVGPEGPIGVTGATGIQGVTGATGAQGFMTSGDLITIVSGMNLGTGMQYSGWIISGEASDSFVHSGNTLYVASGWAQASGVFMTSATTVSVVSGMGIGGGGGYYVDDRYAGGTGAVSGVLTTSGANYLDTTTWFEEEVHSVTADLSGAAFWTRHIQANATANMFAWYPGYKPARLLQVAPTSGGIMGCIQTAEKVLYVSGQVKQEVHIHGYFGVLTSSIIGRVITQTGGCCSVAIGGLGAWLPPQAGTTPTISGLAVPGYPQGIYLAANSGQTNWRAIASLCSGFVDSTDTGVPIVDGQVEKMNIQMRSGSASYYLNNILVATNFSGIVTAPTGGNLIAGMFAVNSVRASGAPSVNNATAFWDKPLLFAVKNLVRVS